MVENCPLAGADFLFLLEAYHFGTGPKSNHAACLFHVEHSAARATPAPTPPLFCPTVPRGTTFGTTPTVPQMRFLSPADNPPPWEQTVRPYRHIVSGVTRRRRERRRPGSRLLIFRSAW